MTDTLQDEAAKLVAWLHDEQAAMMGAAGADYSAEPLAIYGRCENVLRDMSAAFDALEAERDRLRLSGNDIYYLRSINRRLDEFAAELSDLDSMGLGGEAFADEREWLADFIDRATLKGDTE